jgi:glycosyltransferase involved in cell wall biosynthesis
MTLSIIITCFNEARTIKKVLEKLELLDLPAEKEIVIVDDCSTDGSQDILRSLDRKYKVVFHDKNQGKGAALRSGIKVSNGELTVFQDADLELDPNDLKKFITPLLESKADLILGSRFMGRNFAYFGKNYFKYYLANKLITTFFNLLFFSHLTDVNCGYKMFKTDILKDISLTANSFEIEVEILGKVIKKGFRVQEVPVTYLPRKTNDGKKIRLKHAFLMIKKMMLCL